MDDSGLSKGATTALKEGKIFDLDPFPEAVQEEEDEDNDSTLAKIIAEQLGRGRSVYVKELPPKVTLSELEMGLMKFGPIMRNGTQARNIEEGKHHVSVEFASARSQQLAIEASPIMIGDCPVILEQRLTNHTLGDRTQAVGSSSFGKNKLNNHGDLESRCYGLENDLKKKERLENDLKKVKYRVKNDLKEKELVENDLKEKELVENNLKKRLENDWKKIERLENDMKKVKERLENDMKKVKERLDFLAEERNKAMQDAEESNKQVLEMSSKLEDQPQSVRTAVLEEGHVSLFELFESEQIRRLTMETDKWRKAAEFYAEVYAEMLSTGNNGKLMDRSASTRIKCCPRTRGRLRRILKMGRMISSGRKTEMCSIGLRRS